MTGSARVARPDASVGAALVEGACPPGGVEVIVGVVRDPTFGPVLMVGAGGIMTELYRDCVYRLAPVDESEATAMLRELRSAALLDGFRGAPAADSAALANLIAMISEIAVTYDRYIEAVDLNPVAVLPHGAGAIVLDALLVPSMKAGTA